MRLFSVLLLLLLLSSCGDGQLGGPLPVLENNISDETIIFDLLPLEEIPQAIARETLPETSPVIIRVLINTSRFSQRVHESITLTATGAFTVRWEHHISDEKIIEYEAGEIFSLKKISDMMGYSHLYIEPAEADTRIEIMGLARNWPNGENPQYRGRIEVFAVADGFIVINELPLEEYLYAVVPSEMPSSYGLEAVKVQAITARSFAYRQFYENRFRAYGAHIDDSVISQVYNNLPENAISIEAVRTTQGMVLTYEGTVIIANYFSTSGGTTANAGEVWPVNGQFPGETPPYLRARAQFESAYSVEDLRLEENAAVFFRDWDVPGFDREFPFFRWRVYMTAEALSASINKSLNERQRANPSLIQRIGFGDAALGGTVRSIGQLRDLEVVQRGQGGNIIEMLLVGTDASVRVLTEFNIRTLLAPNNSQIFLHNGNTLNGWGMMPSAFFSMEIERDDTGKLTGVTFYGGGHGHGAGMSQNGAKALLDRGYGYREVLMHFYPGTEIIAH
ncbi:MAG: SpoIID/LytB domain-containing protein [Defluviitaleaceae bacterium]|nr:SpoIID/LytB domain-containing protein [Defluviitaleaceae bacterium]